MREGEGSERGRGEKRRMILRFWRREDLAAEGECGQLQCFAAPLPAYALDTSREEAGGLGGSSLPDAGRAERA